MAKTTCPEATLQPTVNAKNELVKQVLDASNLPTEADYELMELESNIVDLDEKIPEDEGILFVGNVPICTNHDLVTVMAEPKKGKTTLFTIFVAAILGGKWNVVTSSLENAKILYIDTEMKRIDTQSVGRKSVSMSNGTSDRLVCVNLRKYDHEEVIEMIEKYIKMVNPKILIIDGIVDLCSDFNNLERSEILIRKILFGWIEKYDLTIFTAIHLNKGKLTPQGHLGYILQKKSEISLLCKKSEGNIVTVSVPDHRHAGIPEFCFGYDSNGMPVDGRELKRRKKEESLRAAQQRKLADEKKAMDDFEEQLRMCLQALGGSAIKKRIIDYFASHNGPSHNTVDKRICMLVENNKLKTDGKTYWFDPTDDGSTEVVQAIPVDTTPEVKPS